ncbi:MAG: lipopolysaccharide biosynthesis protein [Acidimicrobiia bacterium]|nr:lipopolysaccharide biosynthesis protein [Acidimicrobiia bacterium]
MTFTPSDHGSGKTREDNSQSRVRTMAGDLLANRTRWAAVSEGLQLVSSTLVILVVARFLDQESYGVMGGVAGLALIALNLSNFGTHILLLRRGAQGENLSDAWARALTLGVGAPAVVAVGLLLLRPLVLPNVDPLIFGLFIVTGMPLFWLSELVVYLPVGLGHLRAAAVARFIVVACRMVAVAWFALATNHDLESWAWANALSFLLSSIFGVIYISRTYGVGPRFVSSAAKDFRPGLPFSVNGVTENVNDLSDRTLLLRFDLKEDAGSYSLGGRAIQFAYMPLRMLLRAHDSEMFAAGKAGIGSSFRISARLAPTALLLGFGTGLVFWLLAPLTPVLLGAQWTEAVSVVRWLSFLPGVRAVQYVVGNSLSAADRQWWRFAVTALAAGLNLTLNLLLLPGGSWRTAAVTTFVSEIFLMGALILLVALLIRRERSSSDRRGSGDTSLDPAGPNTEQNIDSQR